MIALFLKNASLFEIQSALLNFWKLNFFSYSHCLIVLSGQSGVVMGTKYLNFFPFRSKNSIWVGSKSTWVKEGSASYLLRAKSMPWLGQGPSGDHEQFVPPVLSKCAYFFQHTVKIHILCKKKFTLQTSITRSQIKVGTGRVGTLGNVGSQTWNDW